MQRGDERALRHGFGFDEIARAGQGDLRRAIAAYKQIRDVTQLGDLYRLEDPHENFRGSLNFVSPDQSRAAVFVFQLKDGQNVPVRPQGLDPAKKYTIHELNPAPGRAPILQEGKTFTGEELMRDGILPSCSKALEASVIELDRNLKCSVRVLFLYPRNKNPCSRQNARICNEANVK
ncbi:MAG: GH36 C-terminal domain-containing protein [Limisphaerales bacterium]